MNKCYLNYNFVFHVVGKNDPYFVREIEKEVKIVENAHLRQTSTTSSNESFSNWSKDITSEYVRAARREAPNSKQFS